MDKIKLGQVFTPKSIVDLMINLISHKSNARILEPSSGDGAFYYSLIEKNFKYITAVEIDHKIAHTHAIVKDFFDIKEGNYDVIIGNPPYVDFKNIENIEIIKNNSIFSEKPNLYMYFFYECLKKLNKNGELIFVMPISWMYNTSCKKFNKWFFQHFKITFMKILPENIWKNASVTTGIFKIENITSKTKALNFILTSNGKIIKNNIPKISNFITGIKVGGASGNNSFYKTNNKKHTPFIDSKTERTKKLTFYKYNGFEDEWIRKVPNPPKNYENQIFVNCKTRNNKPFYFIKSENLCLYDASVICIYTSSNVSKTKKLVKKLNSINWKSLGIKRNGRYHFSQSLLKGVIYG